MIWLGWVLWHINHCRLFDAKSSLYIYIKYIGFGLVGFYGISTIVGYLMPNPLYTLLWLRKESLMKTQTRILGNRLYYTRKIELHRKGKKSHTVQITLILICSTGSEISPY